MKINEIEKLKDLQNKISIEFNNIDLLKNALIHRSYLNESTEKHMPNNERLEFLGDAVLELIVTEYLYAKYPDRAEGQLTSFRAATVRTNSLADTAMTFNLGEYIYMSHGEEITGGRHRPYILANTFEALLGAIYLDGGINSASRFVHAFLLPKLENIVAQRLDIDSKSKLQEMCQEALSQTPTYELISTVGPDHAKIFTMGLKIGKHMVQKGEGKNKQDAEQNAAEKALENWDNILKVVNSNSI